MAESAIITAEQRDKTGKGAARATRRANRVPGVLYGDNAAPMALTIDPKGLKRALHQQGFFARLCDLEIDGKTIRALPRDVQFHPVTDIPIHVDFMRVSKNARVTVEVPVHFINEETAPGIKRGGVLNIVRHEIEVSCPAESIPEEFIVDLAGLDIGDSVHFSDLSVPEGVESIITDRDFTVATIAAPTVVTEEEPTEAESAEGEEASEGKDGEAKSEEDEKDGN